MVEKQSTVVDDAELCHPEVDKVEKSLIFAFGHLALNGTSSLRSCAAASPTPPRRHARVSEHADGTSFVTGPVVRHFINIPYMRTGIVRHPTCNTYFETIENCLCYFLFLSA